MHWALSLLLSLSVASTAAAQDEAPADAVPAAMAAPTEDADESSEAVPDVPDEAVSDTTDAVPDEAVSDTTDADADETPAVPPVHDPTLMTIGVTTATIGVVGFAVLAASAVVERGRVSSGCGGMCSDADRDGADGLGIAANVAAGVALVGAVLSLVGIAVMGRPEDDEREPREEEITVSVGPTGVLVSGSF